MKNNMFKKIENNNVRSQYALEITNDNMEYAINLIKIRTDYWKQFNEKIKLLNEKVKGLLK